MEAQRCYPSFSEESSSTVELGSVPTAPNPSDFEDFPEFQIEVDHPECHVVPTAPNLSDFAEPQCGIERDQPETHVEPTGPSLDDLPSYSELFPEPLEVSETEQLSQSSFKEVDQYEQALDDAIAKAYEDSKHYEMENSCTSTAMSSGECDPVDPEDYGHAMFENESKVQTRSGTQSTTRSTTKSTTRSTTKSTTSVRSPVMTRSKTKIQMNSRTEMVNGIKFQRHPNHMSYTVTQIRNHEFPVEKKKTFRSQLTKVRL